MEDGSVSAAPTIDLSASPLVHSNDAINSAVDQLPECSLHQTKSSNPVVFQAQAPEFVLELLHHLCYGVSAAVSFHTNLFHNIQTYISVVKLQSSIVIRFWSILFYVGVEIKNPPLSHSDMIENVVVPSHIPYWRSRQSQMEQMKEDEMGGGGVTPPPLHSLTSSSVGKFESKRLDSRVHRSSSIPFSSTSSSIPCSSTSSLPRKLSPSSSTEKSSPDLPPQPPPPPYRNSHRFVSSVNDLKTSFKNELKDYDVPIKQVMDSGSSMLNSVKSSEVKPRNTYFEGSSASSCLGKSVRTIGANDEEMNYDGCQDIDRKADEFIAKFHEHLRRESMEEQSRKARKSSTTIRREEQLINQSK